MNNLFNKIVFMLMVAGTSLSAEVACPNITPEMEYECLTQMDIVQNTSFSDLVDPIAMHTLDNVSLNHHKITLTDGSEWKIGYCWRKKLSSWCNGDQLRLSIHLMNTFNLVKIENLHQHSVVWGNLSLRPDSESADVRWIVDTYLDSFIELNDGSVFKADREYSPSQSSWGPGNIVFILSNDDPQFPYVLWNMTWNSIIPSEIYAYPPISN
jgi:hypothetical protein